MFKQVRQYIHSPKGPKGLKVSKKLSITPSFNVYFKLK
jgi:hypothetical protein